MTNKRRAQRLKQEGICFVCGANPPMRKNGVCGACADKRNKWCKERREKWRAAGLCVSCGYIVEKGQLCKFCRKRNAEQYLKRMGRVID